MTTYTGKQLSRLMRDNDLSQSALSRATGVPQPTINRILSGITKEPRRDSVVRIANFFGVSSESLYKTSSITSDKTETEESAEGIYKQIAMLTIMERIELLGRVALQIHIKSPVSEG